MCGGFFCRRKEPGSRKGNTSNVIYVSVEGGEIAEAQHTRFLSASLTLLFFLASCVSFGVIALKQNPSRLTPFIPTAAARRQGQDDGPQRQNIICRSQGHREYVLDQFHLLHNLCHQRHDTAAWRRSDGMTLHGGDYIENRDVGLLRKISPCGSLGDSRLPPVPWPCTYAGCRSIN